MQVTTKEAYSLWLLGGALPCGNVAFCGLVLWLYSHIRGRQPCVFSTDLSCCLVPLFSLHKCDCSLDLNN